MFDQRHIHDLQLVSRLYRAEQERLLEAEAREYSSVRTDLAIEARDMVTQRTGREIPGVISEQQNGQFASVTIVRIKSPEAETALGKKMGTYVTIEAPDLRFSQKEAKEETSKFLSSHLKTMLSQLGVGDDDEVLVAGLGNWNATPDAIGPMVVGKLLVTRHLHRMLPPEKRGGLRPISAVSPGVLGLTGIETAEIIGAVVARTRPRAVVVVDALASRNVSKIGSSIQIGNTGISPGSGVGNKRFGITQESLGVPVVAVGVPTVVDALTIVNDAMSALTNGDRARMSAAGAATGGQVDGGFTTGRAGDGGPIVGALSMARQSQAAPSPAPTPASAQAPAQVETRTQSAMPAQGQMPTQGEMPPDVRRDMLAKVLGPEISGLVVTPKEIDVIVELMSTVVAGGMNTALHPGLTEDEIYEYLN